MIKGRILLKVEDDIRHLASYAIQIDGSFYLWLVRHGECDHSLVWSSEQSEMVRVEFDEARLKTKKISYHTTGVIRYHGMEPPTVYREPLYSLTTPNPVAAYIIPSMEKLDNTTENNEQDFVYELASDRPTQFSFSITPWQFVPQVDHFFAIRFNELFSLLVEVSHPTIEWTEELAKRVIMMIPKISLPRPLIDEPTAYTQFHQQLNQTQSLIIYSPNINGEYRVVCAVPMRIPPRLEIQFFDPSYIAEQLEPHPKRGTAEVRFRVRGKGGNIKEEVPIAQIMLDADIY